MVSDNIIRKMQMSTYINCVCTYTWQNCDRSVFHSRSKSQNEITEISGWVTAGQAPRTKKLETKINFERDVKCQPPQQPRADQRGMATSDTFSLKKKDSRDRA